ncbi:hypothetical protein M153_1820009975 [Pseudoloma neurophilia]|uniref:Uncharacterized protein n=1 Tax=Pseudoloma neurophilia TaxID=146866 RepID=A0A0R0LZD2_9MICR|nr:hypothetical protein M153_1820009975 [Pseudoloma neurophilia]
MENLTPSFRKMARNRISNARKVLLESDDTQGSQDSGDSFSLHSSNIITSEIEISSFDSSYKNHDDTSTMSTDDVEDPNTESISEETDELYEMPIERNLRPIYPTRLSMRFNFIEDLLVNIFKIERISGGGLKRFVDFAFEFKQKFIHCKVKSYYHILFMQQVGCIDETYFTIFDLIILIFCANINLKFVNILKFMNSVVQEFDHKDNVNVLISYDGSEKKFEIMSSGEISFTFPTTNKTKQRLFKQIVKSAKRLSKRDIIKSIFSVDRSLINSHEMFIKVKKTYKRRSQIDPVSGFITRVPEDIVKLEENDIELYHNFDLDALWIMDKPSSCDFINSSFYVDFKNTSFMKHAIGKDYYCLNKDNCVRINELATFQLGVFNNDRDLAIHLFLITNLERKKYLNDELILSSADKLALSIGDALEEMKETSTYRQYLSSKDFSKDKERYTRFNSKTNENDEYDDEEEAQKSKKSKKNSEEVTVKEFVGRACVKYFFKCLKNDDFFSRTVVAFHFQSAGSKRFISASSMTELLFGLELEIQTDKVPFLRSDFAYNCELAENDGNTALFINTGFYQNIAIKPYKILGCEKLNNFNDSLISIVESTYRTQEGRRIYGSHKKLRLDPQSIERINSYTTIIPELFDRKIRMSSAGQFTSRIVYETMLDTYNSERKNRAPHRIIKSFEESLTKLNNRNNIGQHSYRIEINSSLYSCPPVLARIQRDVRKQPKYSFKTTKILPYLLNIVNLLMNFFNIASSDEKTVFLKCIIIEIFLVELLIKGTINPQILTKSVYNMVPNEFMSYFKSLRSQNDIALHNTQVILSDMMKLLKEVDVFSIMSKSIEYSTNITHLAKKKSHIFLRSLFLHDNHAFVDEFFEAFRESTEKIKQLKDLLESTPITPEAFITSIFSLRSFKQHTEKYKAVICRLAVIERFHRQEIPKIRNEILSRLKNGELRFFLLKLPIRNILNIALLIYWDKRWRKILSVA